MAVRHLLAASVAVCVTAGLFYLMQALISMSGSGLDESKRGGVIEFVRLKRESDLELKKRKLPDKTPPKEQPPPPPDMNLSPSTRPGQEVMALAVGIDVDLDIAGGPNIGAAATDSDIIPIVRVNPQYPLRAAERGIEGWVTVEFTISAAGTVKDPVVVASHPGKIFNREALRAVRKWKYNPKIEEGTAVERSGVRVRLKFELKDG
jgi:protein TonB